jgi:hypothetical protein
MAAMPSLVFDCHPVAIKIAASIPSAAANVGRSHNIGAAMVKHYYAHYLRDICANRPATAPLHEAETTGWRLDGTARAFSPAVFELHDGHCPAAGTCA